MLKCLKKLLLAIVLIVSGIVSFHGGIRFSLQIALASNVDIVVVQKNIGAVPVGNNAVCPTGFTKIYNANTSAIDPPDLPFGTNKTKTYDIATCSRNGRNYPISFVFVPAVELYWQGGIQGNPKGSISCPVGYTLTSRTITRLDQTYLSFDYRTLPKEFGNCNSPASSIQAQVIGFIPDSSDPPFVPPRNNAEYIFDTESATFPEGNYDLARCPTGYHELTSVELIQQGGFSSLPHPGRYCLTTATVLPTLTFSSNVPSVSSGQTFVINWNSTNATSITTSHSPTGCPDAGNLIPVASGSKSLTAPTVNTATNCTYTATASGPGGVTSKTITVTVTSLAVSAPTLSSIVPNNGIVGSVVPVTLTGTNFAAGATINAGVGITVTNVAVGSATQITATFTIAATATLGDRNVTVSVGGLTSNPKVFTVNPLNGGPGGGGGGAFLTSCGLLVCFSYDPKVIILPPPGFTRIIKPFIAEVAP